MPGEKLLQLFKPVMEANGVNPADFTDEYIVRAIDMVKSRANFVNDLWEQGRFFFIAPDVYAEKDIRKRWKEDTPAQMKELVEVLRELPDFSSQAAEPKVLGWITDNGYHTGNVMNAFRLAVVGECKGPHMFDISELMGKEETIRRILLAVERIRPIAD